jgi:hypothetical protein
MRPRAPGASAHHGRTHSLTADLDAAECGEGTDTVDFDKGDKISPNCEIQRVAEILTHFEESYQLSAVSFQLFCFG